MIDFINLNVVNNNNKISLEKKEQFCPQGARPLPLTPHLLLMYSCIYIRLWQCFHVKPTYPS